MRVILEAIQFPNIDPAAFTIPAFPLFGTELGPFHLRWYALAYIGGLVIGWRWLRRLVERPPAVATKIQADGPERHAETTPPNLHVAWEFPAREKRGPVTLHWYDTDRRPALVQEKRVPDWGNGVLFVGEKGMLLADYGRYLLQMAKEDRE